jgi:O-6-methylguanine DNA methyltransferase
MQLDLSTYETPVGHAAFAIADGKVCAFQIAEAEDGREALLEQLLHRHPDAQLRRQPQTTEVKRKLDAYFEGQLTALDDIPCAPEGTAFQRQVWDRLKEIPVGHTRSYREIASALGRPAAVRAVGAANGRNPIWLIIPCHRVIAADGTLCGYAGGLERKAWLLRHEGATLA